MRKEEELLNLHSRKKKGLLYIREHGFSEDEKLNLSEEPNLMENNNLFLIGKK